MLKKLIDELTAEQRDMLNEFGVDSSLVSRWRTGKRLPTEPQAEFLAAITKADYADLCKEISRLRASNEQRALLERVMGKARGVAVMLCLGVIVGAASVAVMGASSARALVAFFTARRRSTMCVMSTVRFAFDAGVDPTACAAGLPAPRTNPMPKVGSMKGKK